MKSICLNMIVRNEAHIIGRCLDSVLPWIDCWVIVDTGSTDETPEFVEERLSHLPGELIRRPWKDFGQNRTEALGLARDKAEYLLFIDADEVLQCDSGAWRYTLAHDCYKIEIRLGSLSYHRRQLVNAKLDWIYQGMVHEVLTCNENFSHVVLPGVWILAHQDSSRNQQPDKYEQDITLLQRQLNAEPDNLRALFYLAQSYRDAGRLQPALIEYNRRASSGGESSEVWYSLYQSGLLQEKLQFPAASVMHTYVKAFDYRPSRAEPLQHMVRLLASIGERAKAREIIDLAASIPIPSDDLFVEKQAYSPDFLRQLMG